MSQTSKPDHPPANEVHGFDRPPVTIRRSRPDDAQEMLAVARTLDDWFDEASFEEMEDDLEDDPGVVALIDGRIAGWATWYPSSDSPDPGLMELTWIAVRRDLRGRGIGRSMLTAVAEILRGEGIRTLELWTVAESSGLAGYAETRAFYRALGFIEHRIDTVRRTAGGHDRLFLQKSLGRSR
jgi:ribosomal protein S18 acetylase RimI-like enzyme